MNGQRFEMTVPAQRLARKRQLKNWQHVNIGEWEARRLRAVAELVDMPFRDFLKMAVSAYHLDCLADLKREAGLTMNDIAQMSPAERRRFGRNRRAVKRALSESGGYAVKKN